MSQEDESAPASAPALRDGNNNNNNNSGGVGVLPLRPRPRLRREHVLSPITALAFQNSTTAACPGEGGRPTDADAPLLLLAGEDTDIGIYDAETAAPRGRLRRVFRAQPVHGIAVRTTSSASPSPSRAGAGAGAGGILVWGGRSVTVLSPDLIEAAVDDDAAEAQSRPALPPLPLPLPREATAPDWILDGAISPFGDGDHVALLTAHNEVVEARVTRSDGGGGGGEGAAYTDAHAAAIAFGAVRSPSRPILYSGNVRWVAADRVLVAAGTVFGEILVWKCGGLGAQGGRGGGGDCEVLFVFSGHEGSIFGVHISSEMRTAGASDGTTTRLLASCSDDRTVRVWDITEDGPAQGDAAASSSRENGYGRGGDVRVERARQTGFGDSVDASLLGPDGEGDGTSDRCLAVAMGHLSRIWRVEFAPQGRAPTPLSGGADIYSFGEDATAQKWRLSFGDVTQQQQQRSSAEGGAHARPKAALTHRTTYANHSGKQIWAQAIRASERRGLVIATGGADGKIALVKDNNSSDDVQEPVSDHALATEEAQREAAEDSGRMVSFALDDLSEACAPPQELRGDAGVEDGTKGAASFQKSKNAREGFQRYAFIREDRLLVVTSFGRLFLGTFGGRGSGSGIRWAQIPLPEETSRAIFSYSVLRSSRSSPLAFVGTTSGELYYYDDDDHNDAKADPSLRPLARVHGKVADIFCLSRDPAPAACQANSVPKAPRAELLVTVLGSTRAVLMQLHDPHAAPGEVEVTLEPGFSVTAAAFFRGYLVLGSRNGSICVLGRAAVDAGGGYSARFTLRVKLDDAITSVVPLPQKQEEQQDAEGKQQSPSSCFLATCRDGKYRIYELHTTTITPTTTTTSTTTTTTSDPVSLHLLHEVALRSGSVIEGAWFSANGQGHGHDLMVCGFRGKNMVVWNETSRREVASVECGGGHRSFTYTPLHCRRCRRQPGDEHNGNDGDGFRFVFTKASRMHVFSQAGAAQRTLKPGGHGREIKAASASPSGRYVATGAEDTTIRIWERQPVEGGGDGGAPGFRCVVVLEKHATGIQALRWHGDEHLFSSGGSEEFFVWRVRHIPGCAACPLGVVCEAAFPDLSEAGDLRIVGFDVERIPPPSPSQQQQHQAHEDADMRPDLEVVFRISMALSNSTLQSYTYTRAGGFTLRSRRGYTGACLTQLRHLEGSVGAVLTAATDGHLAVFGGEAPTSPPTSPHLAATAAAVAEEKGESSNIVVARLHQNSVKSLDLRSVTTLEGGMVYLVVTGGDDNALGVTCLRSDSTALVSGTTDPAVAAAHPEVRVQSKAIVRSAHAAAVTGIAILRLLDDGRDAVVVTASTDQRVKTWRLVGWQSPGLRIVLLDDRYSAVADSGDLEVLDKDRVLVVGVGMEVWRVP